LTPEIERLEARVNDLEECLAEMQEVIGKWVATYDRRGWTDDPAQTVGLLRDLAGTIAAHPLNA
jgi:hypothetical protein